MTEAEEQPPRSHRQIDGSKVKFWALKRDAVAAAKAMGWRATDVGQVWTRFQVGYAIRDNGGEWMTRERFSVLAGQTAPSAICAPISPPDHG